MKIENVDQLVARATEAVAVKDGGRFGDCRIPKDKALMALHPAWDKGALDKAKAEALPIFAALQRLALASGHVVSARVWTGKDATASLLTKGTDFAKAMGAIMVAARQHALDLVRAGQPLNKYDCKPTRVTGTDGRSHWSIEPDYGFRLATMRMDGLTFTKDDLGSKAVHARWDAWVREYADKAKLEAHKASKASKASKAA